MKKRWFVLVSLALVLALQLVLPAIAQAAPPTRFSGQGTLAITYLPDPIPLSPKVLLFKDETVAGTVDTSVGLPALTGAQLATVNTSIAQVDWATGNTKGTLKGTFTITATNGDIMKGAIVATQQGNLYGDIASKGTWVATQRTGVFESVARTGKWQSVIHADMTGSFTWEGKLKAQDSEDSED